MAEATSGEVSVLRGEAQLRVLRAEQRERGEAIRVLRVAVDGDTGMTEVKFKINEGAWTRAFGGPGGCVGCQRTEGNAMTTTHEALNRRATFMPQGSDEELPAVQVGDALVFTYLDRDGTLCVAVDTEESDRPVAVRVAVNNAMVFAAEVE